MEFSFHKGELVWKNCYNIEYYHCCNEDQVMYLAPVCSMHLTNVRNSTKKKKCINQNRRKGQGSLQIVRV